MKTHIIDITSSKAIIPGPGIRIILDASEIVPNDPGAGTPALVVCGRRTGSFWCAVDTAELDGGEHELSLRQVEWLESQIELVEAWEDYHSSRA